MTKHEAIWAARELVRTENKTACVFMRPGRGRKAADWISGSAYSPMPKGYRLAMFVSVTGLERTLDGSDPGGTQ